MAKKAADNSKDGYIKVYRSIRKHWLWGAAKKTHFEAWFDLLIRATHSGKKETVGYDLIEVGEGQVLTSQEGLATDWKWDRGAVRKFLLMLEKDKMINIQATKKYTMITVCNYDSYQNKKPTAQQQDNISATSAQHQRTIYNNENNDNNVLLGENEKEEFEKFLNWCKEKAPRVLEMQSPITYPELKKLKEKYQPVQLSDLLIKMHNYKPLLKNNISGYLTALNWLSREQK